MNWRPILYEENRIKVLDKLQSGEVEYADLSNWSYQDRFFAFLLGMKFFETAAASYPSPRRKEEVPVWFLLCCEVQMRLHTTGAHSRLPGILKNGPILTRVNFNIGGLDGGFNHKNRKERISVIDQDCARKFTKDTPPHELRNWYNGAVASLMRTHRAFDKHGIFILDQTHLVVPDNEHYEESVYMPVDEHGQRIDISGMTEEQKKVVKYRRCYALSMLTHLDKQNGFRVVAGYELGAGNLDELPQGNAIVRKFTRAIGKGVMKLLIVDRGYIDADFVKTVVDECGADLLIPLRDNMDMYKYAVRTVNASDWEGKWVLWKKDDDYTEEVATVKHLGRWQGCDVAFHTSLMRSTDHTKKKISYWGLLSTFEPKNPREAFEYYAMRTQIEEVNRQIKCYWHISRFTSPNRSLVEAHVLFTLLTYSLVQMHLSNMHCQKLAAKSIETLKNEEQGGNKSVIVYHGGNFTVLDLTEYTGTIIQLNDPAKERIMKWVQTQKTQPRTDSD
jgi:hypothetical protein